EPGGHHDSCWLRVAQRRVNGWGARIRTWDRGTKTRCLTTWLRPTAFEYRNRKKEAPRCAPDGRAGEAGTASKRHRKRRRRTWLRPTAFEYRNRSQQAPRCDQHLATTIGGVAYSVRSPCSRSPCSRSVKR